MCRSWAFSASKGGSRIEEWLPGGRYLTDAIERLRAARGYLAGSGWAVRRCLVLWCQGESDGDAGDAAHSVSKAL